MLRRLRENPAGRLQSPRFIEYVQDFPRTPSEPIAKPILLNRKTDQRVGSYDGNTGGWN